ncbi:patatin-domain-containing protein [Laetiporus sulphureus 93-53]|uniref:Patatin-like phospholipase domain-containing protein n=1 Tax=Laetiporus sulphureus 93-53 TaxID=1314785 RepID=A0A165DSB3_9APHY|nr:patatin-domain-containing protein [Laetiporus sulphureus 93-53]KZT05528.1 patatin-domain-containing protein [Laetiporus sulphureus 93-53]
MRPSDTANIPSAGPSAIPELDASYVDESHMQAFAEALRTEDYDLNDQPSADSVSVRSGATTPRVRKISALSDFAPVNVKVSRRRRSKKPPPRRQEWLYLIVRWPLLTLIFLFIAVQFSLYVLIRQLVNAKEWLSAWRGRKGVLRQRLRNAQTYQEWKEAALVLDEYMHFDEWKHIEEDPYYDWKLVRRVRRSLRTLRERKDVRSLLEVLETCVRHNFAGVESARLYSETFYGTKDLIEDYVNEEEKALEFVRESVELPNDEKRRFFKSVNTNLGTSALCLSGGASFGYYHFGVVKAFLDAGLLPRVISGTSAGGVVAAMACTRTDAELKRMLVPELARHITAFEEPFGLWIKRFWTTGARFDGLLWARKLCFFTRGSMTFKEAYLRTGRILNISVVPADRHSPTKLLNYVTAPDTIIWSALLASAAVPGILNPVVLMQKLKDGRIVPWSWGSKFKDGSLRVDIPVQALNLYFNVTHPIVSQVNPHVHLFFFAPQGSAGKPVAHRRSKGWRGNFLLSAAEQWLKLELTKNFKLIRDLDLLPQLLGQDWSSVFLQRFEGSVTIWPRTRIMDFMHILSDPDQVELARMIYVGQLVTWPKLHMIENRYRLEKQIFLGRQAVRKALSRTQEKSAQKLDAMPHERVPVPNTGTKLPTLVGTPTLTTALDSPLPMDTDAETAYLNRTRKHERKPTSPTVNGYTAGGSSHDSHRQSVKRRTWAASVSHRTDKDVTNEGDHGAATPGSPPPNDSEHQHAQAAARQTSSAPSNPVEFLRRLGNGTIAATLAPFSSMRRNNREQDDRTVDPSWSGDSSSDDDDLSVISRRHRPPSVFDLRSDMERRYQEDDVHDNDDL